MACKRDLDFLARRFETVELPKERKYLYNYFRTEVQRAFLKYMHVFGDYTNFVNHTGYACQDRWLATLHEKMQKIETAHKEARLNMDMALLVVIERGKYK